MKRLLVTSLAVAALSAAAFAYALPTASSSENDTVNNVTTTTPSSGSDTSGAPSSDTSGSHPWFPGPGGNTGTTNGQGTGNGGGTPYGPGVYGPGGYHGPGSAYGPGTTNGSGSAAAPAPASTALATDEQSTGLVLIDTVVDYGSAQAAGTGMVIDADGTIVTNHHVVASSTIVQVTDPATGATYTADVLGYDSTADVAVLKIEGASDLSTITADTNPVAVGAPITAVGNADGGGQLVAAPGTVTATAQNITVSEGDGSGQVQLQNLIEVHSAMVPGDSGGALLDGASQVIGMNVAGSASTRDDTGYAIPISTVLDVAHQVLSGESSATVTIGHTGALGITVSPRTYHGGVYVVGVVTDGAADKAGLTPGSTITALDGQPVTDTTSLGTILAQHKPGDTVAVAWTDASGASHTADATLGQAPLA